MKTEQEKADWENEWPEDGEQCPDCGYGQIEVQEFGQGAGKEIQAWCVGLNGTKLEDADEDDEEGCCKEIAFDVKAVERVGGRTVGRGNGGCFLEYAE